MLKRLNEHHVRNVGTEGSNPFCSTNLLLSKGEVTVPNEHRTGGPANLSGIHYQLLHSLFHAGRILDLSFDDSDEPKWYKLVLEPPDGGDLQLEAPDVIHVEQMKVRSHGAWPLYEVIHEVLPNLYRAFADRDPHRPVREARFGTNARRGNWWAIEEFFRTLGPCGSDPEPPSVHLDDSDQLRINTSGLKAKMAEAGLHFTKRGLFRYIAQILTKSPNPSPEEERRVWELLRAFRFERMAGDSVRAAVLAHVRGRVLTAENTELVLLQLLGDFLEKGKDSSGINPRDLLTRHGLADIALKDREMLLERGRSLLERRLDQRRYAADQDVRASRWAAVLEPPAAEVKPLVFFGESGKGKSWALYARALSLAEQGRLVLLVDAAADRSTTCERAAAVFCHEVWGHDGHIPLERLHERLKTADPGHAADWLELLVDGVQSLDLAEQLASYDWSSYGIRLSFSLTTGGTDLPDSLHRICQEKNVADFSTRELHDYLRRRLDNRALQVPYSEGSILHQPLMASIFCDLVGDETAPVLPTSEFPLLASYWYRFARIRPLAVTAIAELAAQPPAGRAYPWTMRTLRESGIEEVAVLFLIEKGLLRHSADGRAVGLWHDRLLSWAAAEGLVALIRDGQMTSEGIVEYLRGLRNPSIPEARWGRRWMGDAVLDVLWLLLEPGTGFSQLVEQILPELEDELRPEALTLLGDRVVSVLIRRIRKEPNDGYYEIQALKAIPSSEISAQSVDLLGAADMDTRLAAAQILIGQPTPDALDALWSLRCELERQEPQDLNAIHVIADKALSSCARRADDWVRHAIRHADPASEPVHALVYLLPQMENGRHLWFELKEIIFVKVSKKQERCIVVCLEEFHDAGHLDWLKAHARRNDLIGAAARRALFILEPGRQPDPIEGEARLLGVGRGWWLLPHVNADPALAESFIARTVQSSEDPWNVAWSLLSGFESRIAPETLDRLLDTTAELLANEISAPSPDNRDPLWAPFLFLGNVRSLRLIERFEARRGSDFELKLGQWLCPLNPNSEHYNQYREERAVRTLERTGGETLTQVAYCWLRDSRTFWALEKAIELALLRPDERTAELLFEIAIREEVEGADYYPFAQRTAIGALLAIGRTDLAVRGAMKWALKFSWEVIDLFKEYRPTEADLQPARQVLMENDEPIPNVVLTIGLGRRVEDIPIICQLLERAPQGSDLAFACLLALYAIGDHSDDTVRAFLTHLNSPKTEHICTLGLLKIRTPHALAKLKARLAGLKKEPLSSSDNAVFIAVNLLRIKEARREVAAILWEELDRHRILFVVQGNLSAFAELERSDVDDWLYGLAFDDEDYLDFGTKAGAIRALAHRDTVRPFDAALRLMELDGANREEAPRLLLDIDPTRALPLLRERLELEDEVLVMAAIGENLYAIGQSAILLGWLRDPSSKVREGACIAAEVLPWADDLACTLRDLLYDVDWYVRNAANQALDRLWHAREIDRLVDAFLAEADATRRLCLLDIVLEGGHPGLWQRQPWVAKLWEHFPLAILQRAAKRLVKRRKEVRDELKKRKRRD